MTNYICINGKKAELTEEQLKQLGIKLPKANPLHRTKKDKLYYFINPRGEVTEENDHYLKADRELFDVANYCTDKAIMQQRALHETLDRLLWRYAMENDNYDEGESMYTIQFMKGQNKFGVCLVFDNYHIGSVHFCNKYVANKAIEEIIKPFIAAHPNFKF